MLCFNLSANLVLVFSLEMAVGLQFPYNNIYRYRTECAGFLTFRGLCIVIYSYNESQQDELFLNFILLKNYACFGQTYCPSSGVLILYSQQLLFVILVMLTVC